MIVIDKLCYRSKLRYTNAEVKFAYAILTLLFCIISRSLLMAAMVLMVNGVLTVKKGRIPFRLYGRLMLIPLCFLFLSTLAIIVNIAKTPLDAYAVPIASWYVTGSRQSLVWALQLISSTWAAVSCLYFLSFNTTMTDILGVLERLHCLALMIELAMLIYRFIFVLLESASQILTAQKARMGYRDFKTSLQSFGQMGAALLIRAWKRSDALYNAMESRGYQGRLKVLKESSPPKKKEIVMLVFVELLLLAGCIWQLP